MADFTGIAQTDNLKLYKPGYSNVADIEVLNANADALDAAYKAYKDTAVDFIGASSSKPGVRGYVPAPAAGGRPRLQNPILQKLHIRQALYWLLLMARIPILNGQG